jgi:hypothetical protein
MNDQEAVGWKAPVAAAIVGALLVGAFVVYSIVAAPTDEAFARIDGTMSSGGTATFFVSTNLDGVATEPPGVEVAEWVIEDRSGESMLGFQYRGGASPESITVVAPDLQPSDATNLVAKIAEDVAVQEHVVDGIDLAEPLLLEGHVVPLGGASSLIVDRLSIESGYGWVEWHTEGDISVRVETEVQMGEETLIPDWSVVPLLNRRGSSRLIPSVVAATDGESGVVFRIFVPTVVSNQVVLPVVSE